MTYRQPGNALGPQKASGGLSTADPWHAELEHIAPVKPPFLLLSLTMNFLSICYMPKDALGTWETEVDMSGRISSHEDNILVGGDRHQTDKMSGEVEG